MKFQVFDVSVPRQEIKIRFITILIQEGNAKTFEMDNDNPEYVQFLETAQLTEAQVAALKPNTWYEL